VRNITYISLAVTLLAASASAETLKDGCFSRTYSAGHLAKNPNQSVASILIAMVEGDAGEGFAGYALVRAKMADTAVTRDKGIVGKTFENGLFCKTLDEDLGNGQDWIKLGRMTCFAECDGGYFQVVGSDSKSLTIQTDFITMGELTDCGGTGYLGDDGAAQTTYKLSAVDPAQCEQ
jgi:hypothetical protein